MATQLFKAAGKWIWAGRAFQNLGVLRKFMFEKQGEAAKERRWRAGGLKQESLFQGHGAELGHGAPVSTLNPRATLSASSSLNSA